MGPDLSGLRPISIDGRTPLPVLRVEAKRQLDICNSCRYCEGLCVVFPALERRTVLASGDLTQLANVCHDCRACFDACMYAAPHEWDINIPKVLSALRVADYERLMWPPRSAGRITRHLGSAVGLIAAIALVATAVGRVGWAGLVRRPVGAGSPYDLVPYPVLLGVMLAASLYAVVVTGVAVRTYWREVNQPRQPVTVRAVGQAIWYAATLRYLRGGGAECLYPREDMPSPLRRHLHGLVAYGFGLCLVSTIAAGIEQDIAGIQPPYPWLSVPVLTGFVGGVGLSIGSVALLWLKIRAAPELGVRTMTVKDYGLLVALAALGLTGIAVFACRDTGAYALLLLVHLAAVAQAFALAPYSKFVHVVFRFEALVRDNIERAGAAGQGT